MHGFRFHTFALISASHGGVWMVLSIALASGSFDQKTVVGSLLAAESQASLLL